MWSLGTIIRRNNRLARAARLRLNVRERYKELAPSPSPSTKADRRKLRLFGCGCLRQIWSLVAESDRDLVEAAESFADGNLDKDGLRFAQLRAGQADRTAALTTAQIFASWAARDLGHVYRIYNRARGAQEQSRRAARANDALDPRGAFRSHGLRQVALMACVFGPAGPAPTVDPAWLCWRDGTVVRLAEAIYDGRRWADLPILADALEEAGCDDPAVLAHCRSDREHSRGCWVVDRLLGRG
jgi:hypothetical protein